MAYNVSNEFREKVYSGESLYDCILTIENESVPVNQISSIKISSPIIDTSSPAFYIGTFISQSITIKFKNLDGLSIQSGNHVHLEIGQYVNEAYEYVPIGEFLIDDLAENYQTTCEITCLDYATKFKPNINYSPAFVDGKITIDNLLQYICNYFDVELGTYPEINGDVEIGTYDSSVSGKQYISYIAEIKGSNAKMGRDGKLYLVPLKNEPATVINALHSKSWNLGEKYEISQVVYQDAIRNFTFGEDTENTLFIRTDNMFITEASMIENIFNSVNGFVSYSVKCENYGDVSLDSWDTIRYTLGEDEHGDTIYYDVLNNNDIVYEMTVMSTVDSQIPTKQQEITTNILGQDDPTKLKIMRTDINKVTGDITLLTQTTTEIKDDINQNYYNITQTNQLIQNAETGVTNTFSEAGGNNILRNTGLWFKDDSVKSLTFPSLTTFPSTETFTGAQSAYEFWIGMLKKGTNDNAVGYNSILLQQGTVYQEQFVPNGSYSLSFYYKKLIPRCTASVIINDVEYPLTATEDYELFSTGKQNDETGEYITQPIVVTTNNIRVTFKCDINNGVELYDLMCNKGMVKLAYSQNQNETTTDTVNISKGITITSSYMETIFKANANGIRILTLQNATIAYFTDKGLSTKELVVQDKAQICGTLVQDVGGQTWFTRM